MKEQLLIQILEELREIKTEQKEIKTLVADIPLIKQAVLETRDDVKQLEIAQRHLAAEHHTFTHHFNVIDKQLIEHAIDIDKLKNR
ncbi:hypothetical protein D3C85_1588310 [compost metagenome]